MAACSGSGEDAHSADEHQEPGHEIGAAHDDHGGHDDHDDHDEGVLRLSPEAVARIGLATEPVQARVLEGRLTVTGKIGFDEERLAHVSPRTSGRLIEIPARLGDRVSTGALMAVVDSTELGEAKAAYLRAKAHHDVARRHFERERALHRDRIISEQALIETEGEAKEAAADLAASREMLHLLGMEPREIEALDWGEAEPSHLAIRAPFAGRVAERDATLGELVEPGHALFLLADLEEVWLWIDVYERDLSRVGVGQAVDVRFDAWPGEIFVGEVSYLGDQLDEETRTLRARVDMPNPGGRLRPGMFGRASLETKGAESGDGQASREVLAVPRAAVQRHHEASIVFVRRETGVFERRTIVVGAITEDWIEVLDGIEPGEDVVVEGAFLLKSQTSADQLGGHHH